MSVIKIYNSSWSIYDTGFGDRIQQWELAYQLNENNGFSHTLLVEDYAWMETKFIDFPYTETTDDFKTIEHQGIRIDNPGNLFTKLDRDTNYYLDPGSLMILPPSGMSSKLKLKDKDLQGTIKEKVKDRIGIHIRTWPRNLDDNRPDVVYRFDYKSKITKIIEVLNTYPNEKFYLSSDFDYGTIPSHTLFPQFDKSHHPLCDIYNDCDMIDYRNIVDFEVPTNTPIYDKKQNYDFIDKTWEDGDDKVIFINDDGRIRSLKQNTFSEVYPIEKLYELRVKRDIIDLFSLIYSKEFIDSSLTGPFSSYSQFVKEHRIEIEHGF